MYTLLIFFILYCIQPLLACGYRTARYQLLITIWEILIAPFGRVRFRDFFFADIITSMGRTLQDMGFAVYFAFEDDIRASKYPSFRNHNLNVYCIICGFIPFWFRFWQCINKYNDTRANTHLLNAGKYFSKLIPPVVTTIYVKSKTNGGNGFA